MTKANVNSMKPGDAYVRQWIKQHWPRWWFYSAVWRQAFIWTNAGLLLAGHLQKKLENI